MRNYDTGTGMKTLVTVDIAVEVEVVVAVAVVIDIEEIGIVRGIGIHQGGLGGAAVEV